ncbi:uncharacterized protein [Watersipora subatra]|uniref:uncharacterized protein n=1 Tax=Watersipora subatra TaxID=2589382 RepID=UPI00355C130E
MKISTLTDTEGTDSMRQAASGLLVRGYHQSRASRLPPCISTSRIPFNSEEIPNATSVQNWPHLQHLASQFISAQKAASLELGLLIGNNLPHVFISRQEISREDHEPFARLTDLGWILMGNATNSAHSYNSCAHTIQSGTIVNLAVQQPTTRKCISFKIKTETPDFPNTDKFEQQILKVLSSDFQTNHADEIKTMSIDDLKFLKIMKEQIHKDKQGYITMPLPFKAKPLSIDTKTTAMHRFHLLEKKFKKDAIYKLQYHEFMSDIITKGEAVLATDDTTNSWYIPHFGVFHPRKPDRIRVVFDCAAKVGEVSLNDFLLQGPDHMNDLQGILLRFRLNPVAFMGDIERMFHQFKVKPEHQDYLRFIWYDCDGNLATFKMTVHLFGARSSPACATYGLRFLADQYNSLLSGHSASHQFVHRNFYVDDGLTSVFNEAEAVSLIHETRELCAAGQLRLHKIASNSREVMSQLPRSECARAIASLDLSSDPLPKERSLGILWDTEKDNFTFHHDTATKPDTRRGVLSTVASIFDPLGFLSPYILIGKNILQDMCRSSASWDDPLTGDLLSLWKEWKASIPDLTNISIQRCYQPTDFGDIFKAELHHFCDASTRGYGEVSYLRLVNTQGQVNCSLVMSKSRVAPIKPITIPRMELQAAVTAAKVSRFIKSELEIDTTETFRTDSQIVLGYIKNTTKKFHLYVTNRVQQVRDNSSPENWCYVPTDQNPADHTSRGLTITQLLKSNWLTGPDFLWKEPMQFPDQLTPEVKPDDPEVKSLCVQTISSPSQTLYQRLQQFSSWNKAIKVTKFFLNRVAKLKGTQLPINAPLLYIVKCIQAEHFPEVQSLTKEQPLNPKSTVFNLNPFLDKNGVMRIGGRLNRSTALSFPEKHPILLPKSGHFTRLLLQHLHEQVAHQGRCFTLAKMRSSGYWIIGARSIIASLIHQCVTCRSHRAKPPTPQMASLPHERSSPSPPFSYCGIDCFGPFMVKDRRTELKRYGLMVTCLASRAVHLEVLDDMSTTAFVNGIRNVIAIRGPIRTIWCDQGTNFVGAVQDLTEKGVIEFKLNPPSASHMGGVWERMIRTARNVLQSLLKSHSDRLDTSHLRTLMYEVMAIINSRPLSVVTEEDMPLSPNMLLTMKSDVTLPPPGSFDESDMYSRKRWRAVQHIANVFWKRWKTEYLSQLHSRQKWVHKTTNNIAVGDIVLIKDDQTTRNVWLKGRVSDCYTSQDGQIRSAKVLLGNRVQAKNSGKFLIRPVVKLIKLLPVKSNDMC